MRTIDIVNILAPEAEVWRDTARNFASSRFLVAASKYGMNKDESEELMRIAEGIEISITPTEDSYRLDIHYGYSPYLEAIQNRMDASLIGDNSKHTKTGEDVMGEIAEMIQPLFKDAITRIVTDNKMKNVKTYKTVLIPELQMDIGGGSK